MKKKHYIYIGVLLIGTIIIYFLISQNKIKPLNDSLMFDVEKVSTQDSLKIYENKVLGFYFNHSKDWVVFGEPIRSVDLKGDLRSVEINMKNINPNNRILIKYFPSPYGEEIFAYRKNQFERGENIYKENKTTTRIAGTKGLKSELISQTNSKGIKLDSKQKKINLIFLGKKPNTAIEIDMNISIKNEDLIKKSIEEIILSFNFL